MTTRDSRWSEIPAPLAVLLQRDQHLVEPPAAASALMIWIEHFLPFCAACLDAWCRSFHERVLPRKCGTMAIGDWVEWSRRSASRLRRVATTPSARAAAETWSTPSSDTAAVAGYRAICDLLSALHSPVAASVLTPQSFGEVYATLRNRTRGHGDPVHHGNALLPLRAILPWLVGATRSLWSGGLLLIEDASAESDSRLTLRGIDLTRAEAAPSTRTVRWAGTAPPRRSDIVIQLDGAADNARDAWPLRPWILGGGDAGRPVSFTLMGIKDGPARYLGTDGTDRFDQAAGDEVRSQAELGLSERERLVAGLEPDIERSVNQFLDAYLGTADVANPFCGRDEDVALVRDFVERSGPPRNLLLTAPLGRGKSALMVRLAEELAGRSDLAVLFVPVSLRFDTCEERSVLELMLGRLRRLHRQQAPDWKALDVASLRRLVRETLEKPLPESQPLILLLDGIDEATGFSIGRDLLPTHPIERLRVVASARSRPDDPEGIGHATALGWDEPMLAERCTLPQLDATDVEAALRRCAPAVARLADHWEAVDALASLVIGEPLTFWLLLRELGAAEGAEAMSVAQCVEWLRAREPGLKGWFKKFWQQQRRQWGDAGPAYEPAVRALLGILAVSDVALGREELAEIAPEQLGDRGRLDAAVDALRRLIHDGEGGRGLMMAHVGFAKYWREDEMTLADADASRTRIANYFRRVVCETAAGARDAPQVPRSACRGAAAAMRRLGASPSEWMGLTSRRWCEARTRPGGAYSAFLGDMAEAGTAMAENDDRSIRAGAAPPSLAEEVRCAIVRASIGSVSSLPEELLGLLLEEGIWSPEEALAYARSAPIWAGTKGRAELLGTIIHHLPMDVRPRLVDALRELGTDRHGGVGRVLEALDKAGGMESAIDWLRAIRCDPYPSNRVDFMTRIAARFPDRRKAILDEALSIVRRDIDDVSVKGALLHVIATRLEEGPARAALLGEALEATILGPDDAGHDRAWRLGKLLPALPPDLVSRALQALEESLARRDSVHAVGVIDDLRKNTTGPVHDRAVELLIERCRHAGKLEDRLWLWQQHGAVLPPSVSAELRDAVVDALSNEPDEQRRLRLFGHATDTRRSGDGLALPVDRLLSVARGFIDRGMRREALARMARDLDPDERLRLTSDALDEDDALASAHLLSSVLPTITAAEALAFADRPAKTRPAQRVELLLHALRSIHGEEAVAAADRALGHAGLVQTEDIKVRLHWQLLDVAPPERFDAASQALIAAIEGIKDAWKKMNELRTVIARSTPEHRESVIDLVLEMARDEPDWWRRQHQLEETANLLEGARRTQVLREVLDIVRPQKGTQARMTVCLSVARKAEAGSDLRREAIADALAARTIIGDDATRIRAALAFCTCLSSEEIALLVEDIADHHDPLVTVALCYEAVRRDRRFSHRLYGIARRAIDAAPSDERGGSRSSRLGALLAFPGGTPTAEDRTRLVEDALTATVAELDAASVLPDAVYDEDPNIHLRSDPGRDTEQNVAAALDALADDLTDSQRATALSLARRIRGASWRLRLLVRLERPADDDARRRLADEVLGTQPGAVDRSRQRFDADWLARERALAAAPLVPEERRAELLAPLIRGEHRFNLLGMKGLPRPLREELLGDWLSETDPARRAPADLVRAIDGLPDEERAEAAKYIEVRLDKLPAAVQAALRFHLLRYRESIQDGMVDFAVITRGDHRGVTETLQRLAPRMSDHALERMASCLAEVARGAPSHPGDERIAAFAVVATERFRRTSPPDRETFCKDVRALLGVHADTRGDLLATLIQIAPVLIHLGGREAASGILHTLRSLISEWP